MWQEFKTFAMRGNVVDLAVGIILGTAFTGIVTSLVSDMLMPPLGLLVGGLDFSDYFVVLKGEPTLPSLAAAKAAGAVTLNYGLFINAIIRFLILAFAIFMLVRQLNRLVKVNAPPPGPTASEKLLAEIRDLLKDQRT
jgi:large conductance mechanosensitive channel